MAAGGGVHAGVEGTGVVAPNEGTVGTGGDRGLTGDAEKGCTGLASGVDAGIGGVVVFGIPPTPVVLVVSFIE